jgi:hypothetical protein
MTTPKPSTTSSSSSSSSSPIPDWILYALLSGLCAAANGVFAKLVTTTLTSSWAGIVTDLVLPLIPQNAGEVGIAGSFTSERIALGVEGTVRGVSILVFSFCPLLSFLSFIPTSYHSLTSLYCYLYRYSSN